MASPGSDSIVMSVRRTLLRPLQVVALAIAVMALTVAPATGLPVVALDGTSQLQASADELAFEAEFLELINVERTAEGLSTLDRLSVLVGGARGQAEAINEAGYLYHNPNLADVATGWYALGENVGYGPTVGALHDAFMASPGHRANVLKDTYNYGGVGVVIDENSVIWVAVVFMYGPDGLADGDVAEPAQTPDGFLPPFADDEGSVHEPSIGAIAAAGITTGCTESGTEFCPEDLVTRAQMATFLTRAFDLPASEVDYFTDDAGSAHEAAINALASAGMTMGCGEGRYCAGQPVTRAQMATFLMRALDLSDTGADQFSDDDGSTHEAAINALASEGITGGCEEAARLFCPDTEVTRAQMASLIARALGLL